MMRQQPPFIPGHNAPLGVWNAWVARGVTRDERRARLERVPAPMRADVESHLRTVFALRAARRRP